MIILDELTYAQKLLDEKKYPILRDLIVLAKYYKYLSYSDMDIKQALSSYCNERVLDWNEIRQSWKIKTAIRTMKKYRLRVPVSTPITKKELERIAEVNDYNKEKLLFVILVFAKFLKYNDVKIKPSNVPKNIGEYYVNDEMINFFEFARIKSNWKYRNRVSHELYEDGYIDGTTYGGHKIKYVYECSETALFVTDYSNIVLAYLRYKGEKVVGCSCGKLFVYKNSRREFCDTCRAKIKKDKDREYQRKRYFESKTAY
jgi:hypothetical protein